jgi:VanZ family protein
MSSYPLKGPVLPSDKMDHIAAFIVFSILFYWAFRFEKMYRIILYGIAFGSFIEFIQSFIPYRSADLIDVAADLVGVLTGIILIYVYKKVSEYIGRHQKLSNTT